ncbi:TonB-dependent receptor domain-containing protein [Gluconobacter morbifer]|uniref:Putative TonB-dependent receptor n=1 Tax=Gluconobacter morbifer G707 TaxID=1088869 RepID=G6XK31_9PROT|nr:putative TonB-dependent receptor [Gluconobacter morbifer G707]
MTIHVHRRGGHSAVEVVSRQTMDHFVAGTSPMQILALTTPGANFASDDAFGLDTVANTLYVRGFNQTQLGVSMDGIPMGGQGFHNWNGLGVDQMEIQENISSLTMSQGAGALDTPSAQTLGGAITFATDDPLDKAGGRVSQLFGSYNAFRTFGRVDSGVLNHTGTKFYAAYARTDQNNWKGYGDQQEQQANFKLVQPVGDRGKITAVFDYSNFSQYNYLGLTKNMWEKMGRNTTYLKPNYALSKEYATYAQNGGVPPGLEGVLSNDEVGDYAYDGTQIQRNYLSAITGDFHLFPNVDSKTVAYAHVSNGDYAGTNPFLVSPSSQVPMALEVGHPDVRRLGLVQNFDIHAGYNNTIKTGVWYENDRFNYPMMMYEDGVNYPHASLSGFTNGTQWYSDSFNTNTFQFYLQDTYRIIPGMTVTAGFKSMLQTTHGGTSTDNTEKYSNWGTYYSHPATGSLTAADAFLPHFNFDYHFLNHHEVYFDIAENMRAYDYGQQSSSGTAWGGLGTATNSAQSVFNANLKTLRPERTWNYVVGYRYNSTLFSGSVDFYHTDYYNRLAAITTGSTSNTYGAFINVGRETMNGADVAGTLRPVRGLAITNSFSWNNATYEDSHLPYNGGYVSIKGKHQVYYPKFMYKVDVSYTWHHATFNFNTTYTSARQMTYTNDEQIPAYWTSNLNLAYDFGKVGFAQNLKTTFGITNLYNQNYIGGVYGAASVAGDDNANLFVAAPREFFGTVAAQF